MYLYILSFKKVVDTHTHTFEYIPEGDFILIGDK